MHDDRGWLASVLQGLAHLPLDRVVALIDDAGHLRVLSLNWLDMNNERVKALAALYLRTAP